MKFIEEDPDAPFEKVRKMYEFWAKFKSWREFPAEDEEDLETAEDRWQRREMEKDNKKKREEAKKADTKKIKSFIQRAEEADPRVLKKRKEEKEAREAKRLAKGAGKREAEEAARKAAEESAAAAAAEAAAKEAKANAKKELEKQKKLLRKEGAPSHRLRQGGGWIGHPVTPRLRNCAARSLRRSGAVRRGRAPRDPDAIVAALCGALAASRAPSRRNARRRRRRRRRARRLWRRRDPPPRSRGRRTARSLDKACNQKFPVGTIDRWRVSAFLAEGGARARPRRS